MKIDFITRHSVPNYGSILQTYSMQKALEKMGYDSEVINYIKEEETNAKSVNTNYNGKTSGLKGKIKKAIYCIVQRPNVTKMNNKFTEYRNKYLKQTEVEYHSSKELKENLPEADIYCTGSDQIWGKIGSEEYDATYFLDFVPENKKCIAYAASFGVDKLPTNLDNNLENLLKKYETILVREDSAEKIIRKKGFTNVKQVVDPTLLLESEEWNKICEPTKLDGKEYILIYQLHHNKEMENYIKNLKKHTKLPVYRIHPSLYYGLKPGKFIHLPTPGQFVTYIKNAKYIITDSFHGTVFSLIFNKQFVDILPGKTATRIESILKLVGLEDRILRDNNDYSFLNKEIDFENANKILENEREESKKDLKNAIELLKKNINNINKYIICAGCRCCEKICPVNAIEMKENKEGFIEPVVNEEKCISCGLCLKRCPQINKLEIEGIEQKAYATQNKNEEDLKISSSGGMFIAFAKNIISQDGVVYGAAYDQNLKVNHIRVENIEELKLLQGSKYVQSDTADTFEQTKNDLISGRKVLFSGTPCQIAGVKQYLGKDYENLYTIDIVCHGVPSQKLFEKYKNSLEAKENSKIDQFDFRDKTEKGWGLNLRIKYQNNKVTKKASCFDSYYKSFLAGNTYRRCCYDCKYANLNRVGDITIADFWGIEETNSKIDIKKGVSAVIVNSRKGQKIFEDIQQDIIAEETSIESVTKRNLNLKRPTPFPAIRKTVYNSIDNKQYKEYTKENLHFRINPKDIIKQVMPQKLKNTIKKTLKK